MINRISAVKQKSMMEVHIHLIHVVVIMHSRVSFHTGTGNIVPRLVTDLTDFFGENKEFSMILGKKWNF